MEIKNFIDFLFRMGFSASKWKRELPLVRKEAEGLHSKLIPFDVEEWPLLSLNRSDTSQKKGFTKIYRGIMETIYFEPLFSYIVKDFGRDYKLTLVTSTTHEFIFLRKGATTQVYINEVLVGNLTDDFILLGERRNKIGYIDYNSNSEQCQVWVFGKNVGFVVNPANKTKTTVRAFTQFNVLNEQEQVIFMCLILGFLTDPIKR